jgi:hypothetical protein
MNNDYAASLTGGGIIVYSMMKSLAQESKPIHFALSEIPDNEWETDDIAFPHDPESRLWVRIDLCGVPMHLWALEVAYDSLGVQRVANRAFEEEFEAMQRIWSGAYSIARIRGREYALVAIPYAD